MGNEIPLTKRRFATRWWRRLSRRVFISFLAVFFFAVAGASTIFALVLTNQTNTNIVLSYGIWADTAMDFTANLENATGPISWSTSGIPPQTNAVFSNTSNTGATLTLYQLNNGPDAGDYQMDVIATAASGEVSTNQISITVQQRAYNLQGSFTVAQKTYDRTTAATITSNNLTPEIDDVLDGDEVGLAPVAKFANANAGNGKTVSISATSTLTGAQSGNYHLVLTGSPTTTANITQRQVTITPPTFSKIYDRTNNATATGTPSLNGILNGDTVSISGSPTFTYSQVSVGTGITVTPSVAYGLSGTEAGNYSLSQPTLTGEITRRSLSITFTGTSRVYDGTLNASVSASSDTRVSGDNLGTIAVSTAEFTQTGIGTGITVNISGTSGNGPDVNNYTFPTSATTTADITLRPVTISGTLSVPSTRVYDKTVDSTITDASTLSIANAVSSDLANLSLSNVVAQYANKNVGGTKMVSITSASLAGSARFNYSLSLTGAPTASAAITAKTLIVGITATSKQYDGATTASVTYSDDRLSGDQITVSGTANFDSKSIGTDKTVTATSIALSGPDSGNYAPNSTATTLANITGKTLNIQITGGAKVYDGNANATVTYVDNRVSGDNITVTGSATYTNKNAGVSKTITASGISVTGPEAGNYTYNTTATVLATISTRSLTVGITGGGKTYDKTNSASVTFTDDRVSGDSLSITGTATYADKNAAVGKTISATGISVTGTDAANYTYNSTATAIATISKKSLTVTITSAGKVYDSSASAVVTYADDRISGDSITVSGTATYDTKSVGNGKTITASSISLSGTDSGNYLPNSTATTTANITARALTIVGTYTASNKTYDATNTATVTPPVSPTLTTIQGSDSVSLSGSPTFTFAQTGIGTAISITTNGYSLTGTDASNYTLTRPTLSANITSRTVTIGGTLSVASTKVYDGTVNATFVNSALLTLSNVPANDIGQVALSSPIAQYGTKAVGTGKPVTITSASLSGASMANYTLSLTGAPNTNANITARTLVVSATGIDRTYDGTTAGTVTLSSDKIASDTVTLAYSSATFTSKDIGTSKALSVSGITISGTDSGNYSANTTASTTANITARSLTVTITASSKTYDGTAAASVTYASNKVAGDVLTISGTATFNSKSVGTTKNVTATGISVSGTDSGNYTANTTASATANITARSLTVTITASNKTYDGTTTASVTYSNNKVSGDILTVSGTATFASSAVGTAKPVTANSISLSGTDSGNYTTNSTASSSADITVRTLTVTISGGGKVYDASTSAAVSYSSDKIAGDTVTISGTASYATKTAAVGKTITATGISISGASSTNYVLSSTTATTTATISVRSLTIVGTYTASSRVYDGTTDATANVSVPASPTLTAIQGSDNVTLTGVPVFTYAQATVGNGISITSSGYTLSGTDSSNYSLTQLSLSSNITTRSVTIGGSFTVTASKTYNQSVSSTITDSSQLTIVNIASIDANNSARLALTSLAASYTDKNVGVNRIVSITSASLTGTSATNYSLSISGAPTTTATITARSLNVSITASNKVYDSSANATVAYSDNRLSTDVFSISGTASFNDANVGSTKPVTVTGITLTGTDAANYAPNSSTSNTANITARPLTVTGTFTVSHRIYDGTTQANSNIAIPSVAGLSDVQGSDDVTLSGSPTFTFAQSTIGTGIAISTTGYSLTGTTTSNYSLTQPSFTANITKRTVTIGGSLIVAASKIYDSTTSVAIADTSALLLVNVPDADAGNSSKLSLTGLVAQYASDTVGTNKAVSLTSSSITGTAVANYTLSTVGAPTTSADITLRSLTVNMTASNKVYDATTSVSVSYTDNRVNGDILTVSGTTSFDTKNIGTSKTVTATNITLSGTDAANYTPNSTAIAYANVSKRPLTVTGTFTVSSRTYDGTTDATPQITLPASAGLSDVQVNDDATLSGTPVFTFAQATVANGIAISTSGYSVVGADADNYALTQPSFTANITKRPLTIGGTLSVTSSKVYSSTTAANILDTSLLTMVNLPSAEINAPSKVALTGLTATYNNKNVGVGKLVSVATASLTGTTSSNYIISTTGSPTTNADITQKPITLGFTVSNKTYDATTAASVSFTDTRITGDSVTVSGTPTFSDKNVGAGKTVTATDMSISGTDAGNYSFNTTASSTASILVRSIIITITASSKVYDGNTSASVVYADTRVSGDSITVSGTATFASKTYAVTKTVTANGITLSGTDASNYSPNTTATTTASITKRALLVSITASNKVYNQNRTASVTYSDDRVSGDILTVTGTPTFADKNVGVGKLVTAASISISGTDSGNYTQNTTATTTADITKKPLVVTITPTSRVYNATTAASVTYQDDKISGDILIVSGTAEFSDKNVGIGKTVTATGITLSGTDAGNYEQNTTATNTANITQRLLTVTGTFTVASRQYDATTNATAQITLPASAGLSDVQAGDDASLVGTPTFTFAQATVGTNISISTSGYSVSGIDAGNYNLTQPSFVANITQRPLTIGGSLVVASSRVYDKGISSTITNPSQLTLVNVPAGDANNSAKVGLTSLTATYADKNVGSGKAVTLATASLSGTTSTNYTLSLTGAPTTTADITPKSVTISITPSGKTYDGTTSATVTYQDTRISGDAITASGTANFSDKNVGTGKTVTATGISLSGTDANNYSPNTTATSTATISRRTLAVTITASNKVYDGNTTAAVEFSDNRVSGDIFTYSANSTFNNKNVGNVKPVTSSSITLSGTDSGNYTPNSSTSTTANITVRPLAVTISASNKTYDALTTASVTYTDDRVSGDVLTVTGTSNFDSKNIGAGKTVTATGITISGTDSANYLQNSSTTTTADITVRSLTVTAVADAKVYDATTNATAVYTDNRVSGDVLSVSGTASFATKTVGTAKPVTITAITLTGTDATNYLPNSSTSSTADITQRPLEVTGTLQALDKVYDGSRTATYSIADLTLVGVQANDAVGVTNPRGRFRTNANVGVGKVVELTSFQFTGADLGNYAVSVSNSPITYASITARPLVVTISASNKTYDKTDSATVVYSDDRISGDSITVSGTATFDDKTVANGKTVTANNITLSGTAAGNYTPNTTATTTANITAKSLTVSITASNKTYDQTNLASILFVDNRISGDDLTVTSSTSTFSDKNVANTKLVTASGISISGPDSANYTHNTSATTTANITRKPLAVTITASDKTYDRTTSVSVTYGDDRISGDSLTVSGTPSFSDKNVANSKIVTATGITVSGTDSGNYTQNTTATTTANITAKSLLVSITATSKTYDATDSAAVTYTNDRISGDVLTVSGTSTFSDKNVGNSKLVTATGITLSGTDAGNYAQNTTATTTANITKRTLTVTGTFTVSHRPYDATTDATNQIVLPAQAGLSDVQLADDVTLTGTPTFTFAQATIGNSIGIATTGYSLTGVDAANYSLTSPTFSANITKRPLTIGGALLVPSSRVYDRTITTTITDSSALTLINVPDGDANSPAKIALSGLTAQFADKTVADGKPVSLTAASLTGSTSSNYTLSLTGSPTTTANITAKPLLVSITATSKTYDATDSAAVTYTNDRISGDVLTVSGTSSFSDKNVANGKTVTATGITISGADAANYTQNTTATTTANITRKALLVSITASGKTYDATDLASISVSDDRINGDDLTVAYSSSTFANKNVGNSKLVTATGITISGTDSGNYTQNTTATTTANISRKALAVTISAQSKTYDRTTSASVTYSDDRITGDSITVSGTPSFSDKNVANSKLVTATGITLSGTDAGNYTQNTTATTTADITAKSLLISISATSKTYDATDSAAVTYTNDRISGDVLTVSGTPSFSDKNVANGKTVTATGITISGTDSGNYIHNTTATTTANITRKALAVTISAQSKTYDANTSASVTYSDDRISGDSLSVSGTPSFSDKNVANGKTVTATGITISGTDSGNYTQNTTATTTANITRKAIDVTISASDKTYDRATSASVTYSDNRISGDVLTVSGTSTFSDKNVGNSKLVTATGITLSGTDAGNYTQNTTATTTANITAKSLLVSISATSKTYDATDTVIVAYSNDRISGDILTVSGTSTFSDKNVANGKTVTATGITISGTDAGNYTQNTTATTTANITRKALAVTISAQSKTYDATTSASVTYSDDRITGDSITVSGTPSFSDKNVGNSKLVTTTGITISGTDSGNYTQNTTATTTANITRKALVVTISAQSKTYDATTSASVTYSDDRITGDSITVSGTPSFSDKNVGNSKLVTTTGITISGTDAGNYTQNTTATTTANITAKQLLVSITATSKTYDATTSVSVTYSDDRINGDVFTVSGTPTFSNKNVENSKLVTATGITLGGTDAGNYTQNTTATTTANITAKPLLVSISATNKTYDATKAATIAVADDRITGDDLTVTYSSSTFTNKNVANGKTVTATGITISGTDAGNYTQNTTATTTANITRKALVIAISAQSKTYDATTSVSVTYSDDRISGDVLAVSGTPSFSNKNIGTGKTVTATGITISGTDAGNYTQNTTATTTANITAKQLVVTISAQNKTYDATNAATIAVADDRINGDDLTVTYSSSTFTNKNVANGKTVTATGITISGTDAGNYTQNTTATTTANIIPRPLAVLALAANKLYDATNAATVTFSDDRIDGDIFDISGASTFDDAELGRNKPVTVANISLTGIDALNYAPNSTTSSFADITVREITASIPDEIADTPLSDSTPTVAIGSLVPLIDTTVTFTKEGSTAVVCTVMPQSDSVTCTSNSLEDGTWTYRARQSISGLMVAASELATITIDTTAPVIKQGASLDATSDTGLSASDHITNDTTPAITVTDASALDQVVVTASLNGVSLQCNFAATSSNKTCTLPQLTDGIWNVSVTLTDRANNSSTQSQPLAITIDTLAPSPSAAPANTQENGATTSLDATPNISVAGVTPGDSVLISGVNTKSDSASCTFVAASALNSCDMSPMSSGTWTLTSLVTDVAGNKSAQSAPSQLIISAGLAPMTVSKSAIAPMPSNNKLEKNVTVSFGTSAALAGVQSVTFIVFDGKGKVVRRTSVQMKPTDTGASLVVPKSLKGATVKVVTTNQCGVSAGAPKSFNVRRGRTFISRDKLTGEPVLAGQMVLPRLDFQPSEITLDENDKEQLNKVLKEMKGKCGTLHISGFSRLNSTDSKRYLQNLADFRAKAAADYLSSKGLNMWIEYQGFILNSKANPELSRRAQLHWTPA